MNEQTYIENMEKLNIPHHMRDGVLRYLIKGIQPGHFLSALIDNNLKVAVMHADNENIKHLHDYVMFFHNYTPSGCWGFDGACERWCLELLTGVRLED